MSSDDYCYSTSTNQRRVKVDNPRIIFISSRVPAAEVNTIQSDLMSLFLHSVISYFQYNYLSQIQTLAQIHFALFRVFYAVFKTMCLSVMYVVKVSCLIFYLRTLTVLGLS